MKRQLLVLLGLILLGDSTVKAQFTVTTNADNTVTVTTYNGPGGAVAIPNSINGLRVTKIETNAFANSGVTSVVIPSGVSAIEDRAFSECSSLANVTIPNGVASIGNQAFGDCDNLTSVVLPNSVTNIGEYGFGWCRQLENVTMPTNLTSFGDGAFFECYSSTSITIPGTVRNFGQGAFMQCADLVSVTMLDGVSSIGFEAFWQCFSLPEITIPKSLTGIGPGTFGDCTSLTAINVDKNNPGYSSLGGILYDKNQDTLIQYPAGISGPYAMPDAVASVDFGAFDGCTRLTAISVGSNNLAFSSVDGVLFDKSEATLVQYPAVNTSSSYVIPTNVTALGEGAFWYCSALSSISIPTNVTAIGGNVFYDCTGLTNVSLPTSVTSIEGAAFQLYSWNGFTNNLTNGTIIFATNASWINATNSTVTAAYRTGFTNQIVTIFGSAYTPSAAPLLGLPDGAGQVVLERGGLAATTNDIVLSSADKITVGTNADKLSLTISKNTGVFTGSFNNAASPHKTFTINGVVVQSLTNMQGYFLGQRQRTFSVGEPITMMTQGS